MSSDGSSPPEDRGAAGPGVARLGLVLGPLLLVTALFAPGLPLDGAQRAAAGVTALTATWWITAALPIGATSLLPAALLPLLGTLKASEVAPLYMNNLVFLFLGAFVISLGLERWNVHKRIALAIIARVGTRPRQLVLGFMVASAFLSFWINNTSTTLLMLPIGAAVVASLQGVERVGGAELRSSPFAMALLLGMAYSASVGGIATPVGTTPNQVFLGQFREKYPDGPEIAFGTWVVAWLPLIVLYLPVGWWLLTRVALKVPAGRSTAADTIAAERRALGRMGKAERWMAVVFASTALLWVTRADLSLGEVTIPGWGRWFMGADGRSTVSDATVATVVAILCFLIPVDRKKGVYLMDWKTANRMPWEVLLLLGAGFALAGAFKSSGLDQVLGNALGPLLADRPSWQVVLFVVAFMALLTEVTSNTATTAVLVPVLGEAAEAAGISPLAAMLPATIAASAAFMLPVSTPPNAVVFSSRLVPAPVMAKVGVRFNLALIVLVTLVFELWGRRVLGVGEGLPDWVGGG